MKSNEKCSVCKDGGWKEHPGIPTVSGKPFRTLCRCEAGDRVFKASVEATIRAHDLMGSGLAFLGVWLASLIALVWVLQGSVK